MSWIILNILWALPDLVLTTTLCDRYYYVSQLYWLKKKRRKKERKKRKMRLKTFICHKVGFELMSSEPITYTLNIMTTMQALIQPTLVECLNEF